MIEPLIKPPWDPAPPSTVPQPLVKPPWEEDGDSAPTPSEIAAGAKPAIPQKSGTLSTEKSITVEVDGRWYVIPSIIRGVSYTPRAAMQKFARDEVQPLHAGSFDSEDSANAFAEDRSRELDKAFGGPGVLHKGPSAPASGVLVGDEEKLLAKRTQMAEARKQGDLGPVPRETVGDRAAAIANRVLTSAAEGLVAIPELIANLPAFFNPTSVTTPEGKRWGLQKNPLTVEYPTIGKKGGFLDLKAQREDIRRQFEAARERMRGSEGEPEIIAATDALAEVLGMSLPFAGEAGTAAKAVEAGAREAAPAAVSIAEKAAPAVERRANLALRAKVDKILPSLRGKSDAELADLLAKAPDEATERAIERASYLAKKGTSYGPPEVIPKSNLERPVEPLVTPPREESPTAPREPEGIAPPAVLDLPPVHEPPPGAYTPTRPEEIGALRGSEAPIEAVAQEPLTTGIKNAVTEAERAQRELPPIESLGRPFDPVFEEAKRKIDAGEIDPRTFREGLVEKPRVLKDEENAALLYDRMRLSNARDAVVERAEAAQASGDAGAAASARQELVGLDYDIDQNDIAAKLTGSEWSRSGTSRQRLIAEDYSLARVLRRARVMTGGKIPEEAEQRLTALSKQLKEATSAMEDQQEHIAQLEAERAVKALKREAAHGARRARRAVTQADLATEFEDLQKEFARVSVRSRPHLAIVDPDMVALIGQMARNRVASGITTLEEVVDAVYQVVRNHIDGVTPRDVRDAISGYGKTSQPNPEEVAKQLREVKAQGRLVSALEDAEKGERPLKTGFQREPQTQRVRELRRQVNEAMRSRGLDTALLDPQQQMRTMLDAAKTRLRHQIEDISRDLGTLEKGGKLAPKVKTPIQYDAEALALRADRDRLKQALEEIKGPSTMTDSQRLQIAERATEGSVQDLQARIVSGSLAPKAGPSSSPWSPKLAALKKQQAVLRDQLHDLRNAAKPPTDMEAARLRAYKTRLKTQEEDLVRRFSAGDFAKRPRKPISLDTGAAAQKARIVELKRQMDTTIRGLERANRPWGQKATEWFLMNWGRGIKLSSTATVTKLTAAASARTFVLQPIEDIVTTTIGKVPGTIAKIAKQSPRFGGTYGDVLRSQVKAFTMTTRKALEASATPGLKGLGKDVAQQLRTGTGELDLLYGRPHDISNEFTAWFGHLHGALKAPAKRAEFFRSLERRAANAVRAGKDLTNPGTQMELHVGAYADANRAILMQDSVLAGLMRLGLNWARGRGLHTEAAVAESILPIVKVPSNFASEAMEYLAGGVKAVRRLQSVKAAAVKEARLSGSQETARAIRKAVVENLKPEDADFFMRNLGKQTVGAGLLFAGYKLYKQIGGYHQRGHRAADGEPEPGEIMIRDFRVPHNVLHHASVEMLQMGAMLHRVQDQFEERGKEPSATEEFSGLPAGTAEGLRSAGMGLAEQVPFFEEPIRVARRGETTGGIQHYFGEYARGMLLPPDLQRYARYRDQPEEAIPETVSGRALQLLGLKQIDPNKRYPRHLLEEILVGIPGARETVPAEKE